MATQVSVLEEAALERDRSANSLRRDLDVTTAALTVANESGLEKARGSSALRGRLDNLEAELLASELSGQRLAAASAVHEQDKALAATDLAAANLAARELRDTLVGTESALALQRDQADAWRAELEEAREATQHAILEVPAHALDGLANAGAELTAVREAVSICEAELAALHATAATSAVELESSRNEATASAAELERWRQEAAAHAAELSVSRDVTVANAAEIASWREEVGELSATHTATAATQFARWREEAEELTASRSAAATARAELATAREEAAELETLRAAAAELPRWRDEAVQLSALLADAGDSSDAVDAARLRQDVAVGVAELSTARQAAADSAVELATVRKEAAIVTAELTASRKTAAAAAAELASFRRKAAAELEASREAAAALAEELTSSVLPVVPARPSASGGWRSCWRMQPPTQALRPVVAVQRAEAANAELRDELSATRSKFVAEVSELRRERDAALAGLAASEGTASARAVSLRNNLDVTTERLATTSEDACELRSRLNVVPALKLELAKSAAELAQASHDGAVSAELSSEFYCLLESEAAEKVELTKAADVLRRGLDATYAQLTTTAASLMEECQMAEELRSEFADASEARAREAYAEAPIVTELRGKIEATVAAHRADLVAADELHFNLESTQSRLAVVRLQNQELSDASAVLRYELDVSTAEVAASRSDLSSTMATLVAMSDDRSDAAAGTEAAMLRNELKAAYEELGGIGKSFGGGGSLDKDDDLRAEIATIARGITASENSHAEQSEAWVRERAALLDALSTFDPRAAATGERPAKLANIRSPGSSCTIEDVVLVDMAEQGERRESAAAQLRPNLPVDLHAVMSTSTALTATASLKAGFSDVVHGALEAVAEHQEEAAMALGTSPAGSAGREILGLTPPTTCNGRSTSSGGSAAVSMPGSARVDVPASEPPPAARGLLSDSSIPTADGESKTEAGVEWVDFVGRMQSEIGMLKKLYVDRDSSFAKLQSQVQAAKAKAAQPTPRIAALAKAAPLSGSMSVSIPFVTPRTGRQSVVARTTGSIPAEVPRARSRSVSPLRYSSSSQAVPTAAQASFVVSPDTSAGGVPGGAAAASAKVQLWSCPPSPLAPRVLPAAPLGGSRMPAPPPTGSLRLSIGGCSGTSAVSVVGQAPARPRQSLTPKCASLVVPLQPALPMRPGSVVVAAAQPMPKLPGASLSSQDNGGVMDRGQPVWEPLQERGRQLPMRQMSATPARRSVSQPRSSV
eukprot:NODE_48_length_4024_cov_6.296125.p1 GENE.NODE_48_length_4024_cov_6.296125~~NODE_48_length_4024_cov_6.296125.p1  ORF type:complete len:1289 (-),score=414.64 NODE_48_length_4024_cov_6.296125:156-3875(-)